MSSDLKKLDLISAIWILACNDENHLITFEGIRERLGLEQNYDVKSLVMKHRELFRPGAPSSELEEWQTTMKNGKRLPSWIKNINNEEDRFMAINNLTQKDIFRSQFRGIKGALKSEIEIVTWGLEHIDRLRKSKIAAQDANAKGWQMWLLFAIGIANIVVTIVTTYIKENESVQSKSITEITKPIVPKER